MSSHEKRIEQLCEAREFWESRVEQLAGCGRLERYAQSRLEELDAEFYALVNETTPRAIEAVPDQKLTPRAIEAVPQTKTKPVP